MSHGKTWLDRLPAADPNMEKRSFVTNITPVPLSISRDIALSFLHDHVEMIELNPLVIRQEPTSAPPNATLEEQVNMKWFEITDVINYLPGGMARSEVSYKVGFYDLPNGLQTHVFAPAGVDLKARWTVGGSMPGELPEPPELGIDVPKEGLYLREDVELRCNVFLMSFVKRNLRKSHHSLVQDLIAKARDGKYRRGSGAKAATSPGSTSAATESTERHTGSTSISSAASPESSHTSAHHSPPQENGVACSCPEHGHVVMCPNYRYIPPVPANAAYQPPSKEGQVPSRPANAATTTGQYTTYRPTQSAQKDQILPAAYNKPLPADPYGAGRGFSYTTPQPYGEPSELPVTRQTERGQGASVKTESREHDGAPMELDGTALAYWKQKNDPKDMD